MDYKRISYTDIDETVSMYEWIRMEQPIKIEVLKRAYPNVKGIFMDYYYPKYQPKQIDYDGYLQELCDAYVLEGLTFHNAQLTRIPTSLWTSKLRHLSIRNVQNISIELPADFDNQLESIQLFGTKLEVPPALFQSPHLKHIMLDGVCSGFSGISDAVSLEYLYISQTPHVQFDFETKKLPHLQHFHVTCCPNLEVLPNFEHWHDLTVLVLIYLPSLKNLENHWNILQKLQYLTLHGMGENCYKGLYFNELPALKEIEIKQMNIDTQAPFLGWTPLLERIVLEKMNIIECPIAMSEKAQLQHCYLYHCPDLEVFPSRILHCPTLVTLRISDCHKLKMPKEILTMKPNLNFSYDYPRYHIPEFNIKYDINYLLNVPPVSDEIRVVFGHLLLEGLDTVSDWVAFKTHFFNALSVNNPLMKPFIYDNLHLLNQGQQKAVLRSVEPKTIAFLGNLHKPKTNYKKKLVALNFDYQPVITEKTHYIVMGTWAALPPDFWIYPHVFLTEADLEHFFKETQPDFLQHLEQPECESMQALLWTNDVVNERLVVEMIKTGGIPPALLPDLVIISKTSIDEMVKSTLKKLLKAQLPQNVHKILAHGQSLTHRCYFQAYCDLAPDFDVAQMHFCYFKRTGYYLREFFELKQSLNHPRRKEMFEAARKVLKIKPNDLDLRGWQFTNDEITSILEDKMYDQKLMKLQLNAMGDTIPMAVFNHTDLISLNITFSGERVPDEIGQLTFMRLLTISSSNLKSLPMSILDMKLLYSLEIYTYSRESRLRLELPMAFKILGARLKKFNIQPEPIYG
jgi:hypothetical protein